MTNQGPVSEQEYRRRIRIMARILDHDQQLLSMGYAEELLHVRSKDVTKVASALNKLVKTFNSFTQKPNGYEEELLQIYAKYDDLLKTCRNDKEREAIGMMGVLEVNKLLDKGQVGLGGELKINNQTIIKG